MSSSSSSKLLIQFKENRSPNRSMSKAQVFHTYIHTWLHKVFFFALTLQVVWQVCIPDLTVSFFFLPFDWGRGTPNKRRNVQSIKVECFPLKALSHRSERQINRKREREIERKSETGGSCNRASGKRQGSNWQTKNQIEKKNCGKNTVTASAFEFER